MSCVIVPSPPHDLRSQLLPHGVLAVLSEDARVQRVTDVDRNGLWQSHGQDLGEKVPVLGHRLFGLLPEGGTHKKLCDEAVETADVGQLAAGLQSVVGPGVQLRNVLQQAPVPTACPVVASEQRQDASVGR